MKRIKNWHFQKKFMNVFAVLVGFIMAACGIDTLPEDKMLNKNNIDSFYTSTPFPKETPEIAYTLTPTQTLQITQTTTPTMAPTPLPTQIPTLLPSIFRSVDGYPDAAQMIGKGGITDAGFSPEGNYFLVLGSDNALYFYDGATMQLLRTLKLANERVDLIRFSSNENSIFICTDLWVQKFNLTTWEGTYIYRKQEVEDTITGIEVSPNQSILAIGYRGGEIKFIDLTDTLNAVLGSVSDAAGLGIGDGMAFSKDGKIFVYTRYNSTRVINITDFTEIKSISEASFVSFTPNGDYLVMGVAGPASTITMWDAKTYERVAVLNQYTATHSILTPIRRNVAFTNDGRMLASIFRSGIAIWDINTWHYLGKFTSDAAEDGKNNFGVSVSKLNNALYFGGKELWAIDTGEKITEIEGHDLSNLTSLAYNPDGSVLAAGGYGQIFMIDTATFQIRTIDASVDGETFITSLNFTPNGQILISSGGRATPTSMGSIVWRDTANMEVIAKYTSAQSFGQAVVSGDGKFLAVAFQNTVLLFDAANGQRLQTLIGVSNINCLAFSSNNQYLVAGIGIGNNPNSWKGQWTYWNIKDGFSSGPYYDYPNPINSVAISPNNKNIITGSVDTNATSWDLKTGQEVRSYGIGDSIFKTAYISDDLAVILGGGKLSFANSRFMESLGIFNFDVSTNAIAIHPSRKSVAVAFFSGMIGFWDLDKYQ